MRDILFRAKRWDNGEWVEGDLIKNLWGNFAIRPREIHNRDSYLDDPSIVLGTVGQYTGLNDKNGKKIFEGDIVTFDSGISHKYIGVITYDRVFFVITVVGINGVMRDLSFMISEEKVEVIGNVHDNPELLKGEQQ